MIEVMVGRIGRPHGLRGHVTVDVRTDEPERRFAVGEVLRAEAPKGSAFPHRELTVEASRVHQGIWQILFAELQGREAAESARGVLVHADVRPDETPDDPDEFYDHQLIGLEVVDQDGTLRGTVTGLTHGAQDLLHVRTREGSDRLVPFVSALVPDVDLAKGRIEVADRPGLLADLPDEGHEA
ncbi:MAG: ribosome maturation factor RimM [Nocardioides sp.]